MYSPDMATDMANHPDWWEYSDFTISDDDPHGRVFDINADGLLKVDSRGYYCARNELGEIKRCGWRERYVGPKLH